jgi:hypothetical protein
MNLLRLWNEIELTVLRIPIHCEIASIQCKNGGDAGTLSQIHQGRVGKLPTQTAVATEKRIDPGKRFRSKGKQGQQTPVEPLEEAVYRAGIASDKPVGFGKHRPASQKWRPKVLQFSDTAVMVLIARGKDRHQRSGIEQDAPAIHLPKPSK